MNTYNLTEADKLEYATNALKAIAFGSTLDKNECVDIAQSTLKKLLEAETEAISGAKKEDIQPVKVQLVCSLDEQQCQQECKHKEDRRKCQYVQPVPSIENYGARASVNHDDYIDPSPDEMQNIKALQEAQSLLKENYGEPERGINIISPTAEQGAEPVASHSVYVQNTIEQKFDEFFGKGYWEKQYKKHIVIFTKACHEFLTEKQSS